MIGQEEEMKGFRLDDVVPDAGDTAPERGGDEIPPLTPEELEEIITEASLFVTEEDMENALLQEGIAVNAVLRGYLREVGEGAPLTPEEEADLAARLAEGDDESKKRLIEGSLRLVISVARRYADTGVPILDLIQEGNLGLMSAAENYDRTKGYRFSSYVVWHIRRAVIRAAADTGRDARLSAQAVERVRRVMESSRRLKREYGREPSAAEISRDTGLTEDLAEEALNILEEAGTKESEPGSCGKAGARDMEKNDSAFNSEENIRRFNAMKETARRVLHRLSPHEEQVIRMRFGLDDGRAHTVEETAKAFGITAQRVRQIEVKAFRGINFHSRIRSERPKASLDAADDGTSDPG